MLMKFPKMFTKALAKEITSESKQRFKNVKYRLAECPQFVVGFIAGSTLTTLVLTVFAVFITLDIAMMIAFISRVIMRL